METIFALASAQGRAGVAVIRLSGPDAFRVAQHFIGTVPKSGRFGLREFRDQGQVIDELLVLRFTGPNSFTGEDVIEFQSHGSLAVTRAILAALANHPLARMAQAGEFTRRALENNRLNLAQVEALSALIDAETEAQRRLAYRVFAGALGEIVEDWRGTLLRATALLEVTIDFADEEIPTDITPELRALMFHVKHGLEAEIAGSHLSERIRDGFEVAILGAPNAGKSTLLNALAGRDAAITSELAGTTRDVIEVRMDLRGLSVTLLDTAGLRETEDEIESIGIARAKARADKADLRIFLQSYPDEPPLIPLQVDDIVVLGKADLHAGTGVSGLSGAGVDALIAQIAAKLSDRAAGAATATHLRHRLAMQDALYALDAALGELALGLERSDLVAEHLRSAIRKLDMLIGRVDVEMILGEIFSRFCLGK